MKEQFDCVVFSRADLEGMGYDTSGISDESMERFAEKIGDVLISELYWDALESLANQWQIPSGKRDNPIS